MDMSAQITNQPLGRIYRFCTLTIGYARGINYRQVRTRIINQIHKSLIQALYRPIQPLLRAFTDWSQCNARIFKYPVRKLLFNYCHLLLKNFAETNTNRTKKQEN